MSNAEDPIVVTVDQFLESSLDSVDFTEERVKVLAGEIGFPEDDAYELGYAVREAMVNAVVHGNRYSSNKKVHLVVGRSNLAIQVSIEDEGEGFQFLDQADPLAKENLLNQSGRGIMIIKAFVDELVIEKAERGGTRVVMKKAIPLGT